jgi:hypothetical protein
MQGKNLAFFASFGIAAGKWKPKIHKRFASNKKAQLVLHEIELS